METDNRTTFTFETEDEAIAFASYLCDCSVNAKRKGKSVKSSGEPQRLAYLFDTFIKIALI